MLLRDQIRLVRQAPERGSISLSPDGDDLAVGAMHLGSADRQPGVERTVELADRVEAPAGDHMVPDDVDLPFDPTLPGRSVGGEDVDGEPVMVGERGRFRMQRHRQPGGDVAPDDGLGAVIDQRARTPPKCANARR